MLIDGFETETIKVDGKPLSGVLVSPAENDQLVPGDISLPVNAKVWYRLDIPKSFTKRLRGQKVLIRGEQYDVADKPHYIIGNTPGNWNRYALAYRLEGDYTAEVDIVSIEAALDELGDPVVSEYQVFSGLAQARMESGSETGGTAMQTDSSGTWYFVVPWQSAFASLKAKSTFIYYLGEKYDVMSIENVDNASETASFKAVCHG